MNIIAACAVTVNQEMRFGANIDPVSPKLDSALYKNRVYSCCLPASLGLGP